MEKKVINEQLRALMKTHLLKSVKNIGIPQWMDVLPYYK